MDLSLAGWMLLAGVTLGGALAQSAFGFGYSLLTVPFYLLIVDPTSAIQLGMLLTCVVTAVMLPKVYLDAPRDLCLWLMYGTVLGLPAGIVFFLYADATIIRLAVAASILVALLATVMGRRRSLSLPDSPSSRLLSGAVSGAMVTALAMAGPALAVYLQAIAADKKTTRAVIFVVFAFSYPAAMLLQFFVVGFTPTAISASIWMIPVVLLGSYAGHRLSMFISEAIFSRLIFAMLVCIAAYLLMVSFQALFLA